MSNQRGAWRTRFGFYLLAIGSACSLGNLWRFPYVVGENGGGAFVLLYILIAMILGAPLLIAELMLGRVFHKSVMSATLTLSHEYKNKYFKWSGRIPVLLSLIVLSYYSVISGWVLHFITQFFVAIFSSDPGSHTSASTLMILMENGWLQWALASVHVLIALVLVVKGVQEGLEKWISSIMPWFAFLVVIMVMRSMSLPSSTEVLRFLFYPDFSKLTFFSLNHAIGHVFFTLSVGFGMMVTFGSYMNEKDHIPTAGIRVAIVDIVVSLIAGLLVFPLAFQASNLPLTDPALLFDVLPKFLVTMPGGVIFGFVFFLSLYFAALNATIGLLENIVSNIVDLSKKKLNRNMAAWLSGISILILAMLPALSSSSFSEMKISEKSMIENLDNITINWLLPIGALLLMFTINQGLSNNIKEKMFVDREKFVSYTMYPYWIFVLKWLAPAVIMLGLFLQIVGLIFSIKH